MPRLEEQVGLIRLFFELLGSTIADQVGKLLLALGTSDCFMVLPDILVVTFGLESEVLCWRDSS